MVSLTATGDPQPRRVLVVEDEFLVSMDIQQMLAQLGCEVVGPCGDLDSALREAKAQALDVALLDVNIRGQPVTPVADALAARAVPFVFCTGYRLDQLTGRYPGAPRLMKPFQIADLDALLRRVVPHGPRSAASARSPASGRGRRAGRRPAG
jgi:DNA-binding response OmpR family regulator